MRTVEQAAKHNSAHPALEEDKALPSQQQLLPSPPQTQPSFLPLPQPPQLSNQPLPSPHCQPLPQPPLLPPTLQQLPRRLRHRLGELSNCNLQGSLQAV